MGKRGTFASLRVRNFRLFVMGQGLSGTGTWMQFIAEPLLVLKLTNSGLALGIDVALGYLPILLFGTWGGVLADRFDARRVQVFTQLSLAATALALWLLVAGGVVQVWMVYLLSFVAGTATAVDMPTRQSFYLDVVGPENLTNAMSLFTATFTASRITGAALGGVLVATIGFASVFLVNSVSYLAVVAVLLMMRVGDLHPRERVPRARGQIREGIRYVRDTPGMRLPIVVMLFVFTFAFNWSVLLPLFATRELHGHAGTFGAMMSVFGVGSLVGALAMASRAGRPNPRRLAVLAMIFGALSVALAVTPTLPLALALLPFVGAAGIAFSITGNSTLQLISPSRMRGRVMALYAVVFLGSTPIGGPIAGWVGEHLGSRVALAGGGAIAVATGLWGLAAVAAVAERGADPSVLDESGIPDLPLAPGNAV
jgi:predicted MFS family arabinose efflux permease